MSPSGLTACKRFRGESISTVELYHISVSLLRKYSLLPLSLLLNGSNILKYDSVPQFLKNGDFSFRHYLAKTSFYQTFDECLYRLREAKEELADISRTLKLSGEIEVRIFSLHQGNPFYNIRRELDKTMGYADHVLQIGLQDDVGDRFTRFSYHIEEIAGNMGVFIGRLNHYNVEWKTKRSCSLVFEIVNKVELFNNRFLPYSKYALEMYKGNINLRELLTSHVEKLRGLCT